MVTTLPVSPGLETTVQLTAANSLNGENGNKKQAVAKPWALR